MPSYYIVLERAIPIFDVYVNGNMLAKESDTLEKLAKKIGVTPLLSFFSIGPEELTSLVGDDGETIEKLGVKAPNEQWFNAEDGLITVRKLISHLEFLELERSNQVLSNLKDFERVLEAASQSGVRWHLAIDY
jgi:hypothetical protein